MAEPKTSTVFVRLTRDFPAGGSHRRAGIELGSGPRPVEVEVTDEQLAALEGDRYIELVDDKEAQKWEDRLGEAPLATSLDHPSVTGDDEGNGRNYGDGNENDDEGGSDEPETAAQLAKANNRDALVALAADEGAEHPEDATKAVIADAIVANREANANDGE